MKIFEPRFYRAIWLFPFATALHNLEEALGLPAWSHRPGALHPPVGATEFRFAVLVLTVAAFAVTALASWRRGRWLVAAAAYWTAMLANVFVPHLVASIVERGYTPGVITAIVLNLPVNVYLLFRGLREGHFARRDLVVASCVALPALVALIPLLFRVGGLLVGRAG